MNESWYEENDDLDYFLFFEVEDELLSVIQFSGTLASQNQM